MAVEGFFTVEEQRALVYEYFAVPYGAKGRFLVERGVSSGRFGRWRAQVFADTLDQGLVPRGGVLVSVDEAGALARLLAENRKLREQLDVRGVEHHDALAARDEELDRQRRVVDALGKAIELLHPNGDSKNSTNAAANPSSDPSSDLSNRQDREAT